MLRACLTEQAADISARLKHRRLGAHTVQVKVRYGDFTTLTRQITVEGTADRSPRHLPAGLLPAGPGEAGIPTAATARPGRGQPARTERAATRPTLEQDRGVNAFLAVWMPLIT